MYRKKSNESSSRHYVIEHFHNAWEPAYVVRDDIAQDLRRLFDGEPVTLSGASRDFILSTSIPLIAARGWKEKIRVVLSSPEEWRLTCVHHVSPCHGTRLEDARNVSLVDV